MKIIGTGDPSEKPRLSAKDKRILAVQKGLEESYLFASGMMMAIPVESWRKDGVAIAMNIPSISEAHARCCRQSDKYLEIMEKFLASGAFIQLGASHLVPLAIILANHGINVLAPILSFIPSYKKPETPPEQKQPEFSEEDRAMLMISLLQRQQMYEEKLNGVEP